MPPRPVKDKTTGKHVGFGKVILFGEHVVVHGAPAIVAGVSEYTDCSLVLTKGKPGFTVVDKRPAVPGYITEKAAEQKLAHELVFKHLNIDLSTDGLEIRLGGPLVPSSGIGASASDVVSLSRALSELYGLKLSEAEVNASAYAGEKGYHGTPSGVDNTAATYGGLLSFQRTQTGSVFTGFASRAPLYLVVIATGVTSSTIKVVEDVRRLKEKDPQWFNAIVEKYRAVYAAATAAIERGDVAELGRLLNENHTICQELTVSSAQLDAIVGKSRELGALGAKMSGTGRGGIALALCKDAASQKKVADGLKAFHEAKFVWQYSVMPTGKAKL